MYQACKVWYSISSRIHNMQKDMNLVKLTHITCGESLNEMHIGFLFNVDDILVLADDLEVD